MPMWAFNLYDLIFWNEFLYKHSSQISLTLCEHIAFMEAVETFTKYGQPTWIIRETNFKRLAQNNNLEFNWYHALDTNLLTVLL